METSNQKTKVCKKCGRELTLDSFGESKTTKDGKRSWCRECSNASARDYFRKKRYSKEPVRNPALEEYTPQELITELRARGYEGQLTYTEVKVHKIKL